MNTKKKYSGVVIPAVTPLTDMYTLDEAAVEKMFNNFYQHQVQPFILGTTGECASLSASVKTAYLKAAIKFKQPNSILYAGISSNCLDESIAFANECFDAGVNAVAATLPSYYALNESQMKTYFEQLADAIKVPLIIYNITATTHMSIPLQVIDVLSHHENIVAVKDSERSDERLHNSLNLWRDRNDFSYFLGWAAKSAEAMLHGADGLIPSTGNLYPKVYNDLMKAVALKDETTAYELQKLSDVLGNLYQGGKTLGESLWALKTLMNNIGLCSSVIMPPLQSLSAEAAQQLIKDWTVIVQQEKLEC